MRGGCGGGGGGVGAVVRSGRCGVGAVLRWVGSKLAVFDVRAACGLDAGIVQHYNTIQHPSKAGWTVRR